LKIFNEEGKELGLYDLAEAFIEAYPDDIFIKGPYPIPEIRKLFKKLLEIHDEKVKKESETES